MTSAELRRIVGAMTEPEANPENCPRDSCFEAHSIEHCPWLRSVRERDAAIATLVNHADSIVALVEACESVDDAVATGISMGEIMLMLGTLRTALESVHAVKETP